MKRRQLFKMLGRTGLGLLLARVASTPKQSEDQANLVRGVDVAVEGADQTVVSIQTSDDLGGYLVPPEYQDRILQALGQGGVRGKSSYATGSVARRESRPVLSPASIISQERDLTVLMEALNREKNNPTPFFAAVRDDGRRDHARGLYWNA